MTRLHRHGRRRRAFSAVVATLLGVTVTAAAVAACGAADNRVSSPTPAASTPGGDSSSGAAAGSKLAPGLYDLEDGSVIAVGTIEYRDLEGGFWAVVGGTQTEENEGDVVAVIANGDEFADQFLAGRGLTFEVYGERAGDASVRMAGPEIVADRVVLAAEGGPAD